MQQYLDFTLGIYADPLFFGNFPASVQAANFPGLTLSTGEQAMLAGSMDYFALSYSESLLPTAAHLLHNHLPWSGCTGKTCSGVEAELLSISAQGVRWLKRDQPSCTTPD